MEFAVKWMYSVDSSLRMPWDDKLVSLLSTDDFRGIVDADLLQRLDLIRKLGNQAAHTGKQITKDDASVCLENLFYFLDFVAYCYADHYEEGEFDPKLLDQEEKTPVLIVNPETEIKLQELIKENEALREKLTARREEQQETLDQ